MARVDEGSPPHATRQEGIPAGGRRALVIAAWVRYVWAYNLDTHRFTTTPECPDPMCQMRPGNLALTTDHTAVTWQEGQQDLLPGGPLRVFLAAIASWTLSPLPTGQADMAPMFVTDGRCMFAGGNVKGLNQTRWTLGPGWLLDRVVDDGTEWIWANGLDNTRGQILSAPKASCCDHALETGAR